MMETNLWATIFGLLYWILGMMALAVGIRNHISDLLLMSVILMVGSTILLSLK